MSLTFSIRYTVRNIMEKYVVQYYRNFTVDIHIVTFSIVRIKGHRMDLFCLSFMTITQQDISIHSFFIFIEKYSVKCKFWYAKYGKLPVSFQCNERDSVTNFIYHSESYNTIYVNFVFIENSQIRVCSASVSDTVSIGFLFIAYTGG